MRATHLVLAAGLVAGACAAAPPDVDALRRELRGKGTIAFSARSEHGDWDLFLCRADGTNLRNLTRTPDHGEILPRFSPDGQRILFRRLPAGETVDGNRHGTQGALAVMDHDGANLEILGGEGEFPWAGWGPDGRELTCLSTAGIGFVDLPSREIRRALPRQGFFQQISRSPDGARLVGVANAYGEAWTVACLDLGSGKANAVSLVDSCTPAWFADSERVVYSCRPPGQATNGGYGWTQLWMARIDGSGARLVYAEEGRHLYGARVSPDMAYLLFTGNLREDGDPQNRGAPMHILRMADTPMSPHQPGPLLELPVGFSPDWTAHDVD